MEKEVLIANALWGTSCSVAIAANVVLFCIVAFRPSKQLGWCSNILFCIIVGDILFCLDSIAIAPFFHNELHMVFIICFGPFSAPPLGGWLLLAWTTLYSCEMGFVAIAFAYRYCAVAKPSRTVLFASPLFVATIATLALVEGTAAFFNGMHTEQAGFDWPEIEQFYSNHYYYITDARRIAPINWLATAFVCFMEQLKVSSIFFFGFRIHSFIARTTFSPAAKSLHRKALLVLSLQALNSLFFCFVPPTEHYLGLVVDTRGWAPINFISCLHSLNNPIIVIALTDDYRRLFTHRLPRLLGCRNPFIPPSHQMGVTTITVSPTGGSAENSRI